MQRILESLVAYRQRLAGTASLAAGLRDVGPIDELPAPIAAPIRPGPGPGPVPALPPGDVSCCL